ncbi:MAG: TIGR00730 family Rossman fold protein [Bdellovibrionaceae bacterium]|nr:TIGR00730 family Rossman fold protein [Pseudobdellovibrionaceae bacterium]|tara:strand:+ start:195 stop:743 length:549 start_codon:yes stop_codon:yes gene_type:complete
MKWIGVFCGSLTGNNPAWLKKTFELGEMFADQDLGVVYGGGNCGLMNEIAQGVLSKQGQVIGVLPEILKEKEKAKIGLSELHYTHTLFQRKEQMIDKSDAFVILPGGFGTLDEFYEVLVLRQVGHIQSPVYVMNWDGYYTGLLQWMEQQKVHGLLQMSGNPFSSFEHSEDLIETIRRDLGIE